MSLFTPDYGHTHTHTLAHTFVHVHVHTHMLAMGHHQLFIQHLPLDEYRSALKKTWPHLVLCICIEAYSLRFLVIFSHTTVEFFSYNICAAPLYFHVTSSSTCLHESKISQQYLINCRKTCSPYLSILFSSRLSECFSNLRLFLTLYPFIAVLSSCSPHLTPKLLRGSLSNLRQVDIQTFAQPHLETALSPADFQEVFTLHDSLTCRILQASQARE